MNAYVFPGQGAQFEGMGLDLYENSSAARALFDEADDVLGFSLSQIMFKGTAEELKQTKITQPALFVHAIATLMARQGGQPSAVAGHSLGEFSALVAAGSLSFEAGLQLVYKRATAMQKSCENTPGTMAAVLGLDNEKVEEICHTVSMQENHVVVAANYNCPGQLVISGNLSGVNAAMVAMTEAGAKRALLLEVGGAFHSPLMASAKEELEAAILATTFLVPSCPIFQNVNALPSISPIEIQKNLIAQLTGPVKWTQSIQNMINYGITKFVEVGGSGKVLSGLIKKVDRNIETETL